MNMDILTLCNEINLQSEIKSRVMDFADIFDESEAGTEFIEWIFNRKSTDYTDLPENTSLQRNIKKHLLSGGVIREAYGKIKS